jgi:hypothetical protein
MTSKMRNYRCVMGKVGKHDNKASLTDEQKYCQVVMKVRMRTDLIN